MRSSSIPVQSIGVCDEVDEWPEDMLEAVLQSLLHALGNSADHG
ncbi:hypothetical protein [Oligoflexus sp.]|nr:hypothetical protein [Oligoflexus sp.]